MIRRQRVLVLALVLSAAMATLRAPSAARADLPLELRERPIVAVEIAGETAGTVTPREIGVPLGAHLTRQLLRAATERLREQVFGPLG